MWVLCSKGLFDPRSICWCFQKTFSASFDHSFGHPDLLADIEHDSSSTRLRQSEVWTLLQRLPSPQTSWLENDSNPETSSKLNTSERPKLGVHKDPRLQGAFVEVANRPACSGIPADHLRPLEECRIRHSSSELLFEGCRLPLRQCQSCKKPVRQLHYPVCIFVLFEKNANSAAPNLTQP